MQTKRIHSLKPWLMNLIRGYFIAWALVTASLSLANVSASSDLDENQLRSAIETIFPEATEIRPVLNDLRAWPIYQVTELIGYAFLSRDFSPLPGFSGAPYDLLIGINRDGSLQGVRVLNQHEPIFLHGLGTGPLISFTEQYPGLDIRRPIKLTSATVRTKHSGSNVYIDGITKATISAVVLNETVMLSALQVAQSTGIIPKQRSPAVVRDNLFESDNWAGLVGKSFIGKIDLREEEVNAKFSSSSSTTDSKKNFIKLSYTYLNPPSIGINLLGKKIYEKLMSTKLKPGEHAFLIANSGPYSLFEDDFTPGTPSDRLALEQHGVQLAFRDLDFFSVVDKPDIEALMLGGMPELEELRIFRIKAGTGFDPSAPFKLNLVISRPVNHLVPDKVVSFESSLDLPATLFKPQKIENEREPLWVSIWNTKLTQVALLATGLFALTVIILFHRWITEAPKRFRIIRWTFLLYTLVFIGFIAQAQLSITNLFMVILVFLGDSSAEVLLLDPIIFLLWIYVLVTLVVWGRGYFCGWLCPFGIMQEMVVELGKFLKIKQVRIKFAKHQRLWLVKYVILVFLVVASVWSISLAERAAEIEPFKTAVTLGFIREWPFVVYAVLLLVAGLFIHKFFCRYLCPLGALLSIIGYFPLLKSLPRRAECGAPCQLCSRRCGISAIEPNGKINYRECIQCYDCEVIYRDEAQCVPLINAAKGKRKIIAKA